MVLSSKITKMERYLRTELTRMVKRKGLGSGTRQTALWFLRSPEPMRTVRGLPTEISRPLFGLSIECQTMSVLFVIYPWKLEQADYG